MQTKVHIGTSGWSYRHWKGNFYPDGLKAASWLSYYAQHFQTTEINGSFYRLPSRETVISWMSQVPPGFLFCPKMSRYLTHMKKLRDPEEPLERFFEVFEPMAAQMGPVLIQLPALLKWNYDLAEQFYGLLQSRYGAYRFVMEARHPTWLQQDSLTLMAKYAIGWVMAQSGERFPYAEEVTAENIYIRFHGPSELYASRYSDEELHSFARKMKWWEKEGHVIWAFFNNDVHGYAPNDALRLQQWCYGNEAFKTL